MKKFYTFLVVLLPVLAVYSSPIPGFDLGTFCVLLLGIWCVAKNRDVFIKLDIPLGILVIYTVFITIIMLITSTARYSAEFSIIMRTIRFVLMIFIVIGIGYDKYFDFKYFIKALRFVTLFVAIYAILQLLYFNITGLKLINVFGSTKQAVVFNANLGEYETMYRPPSIFLEPSGVAYYIVPYLCYCLFADRDEQVLTKRKYIIDALIITIGTICTTSGQGMISVIIVWMLWFLLGFKGSDKFRILSMVPAIIIMLLLFRSNEIMEFTFGRIFGTGEDMSAIDARDGGYDVFKSLGVIHKIFGMGYGNYDENIYYSSLADILCCTGVVGLILVGVFYLRSFIWGRKFQRIIVIISFFLMTGGGIYTATYLCFYFPMLLVPRKIEKW